MASAVAHEPSCSWSVNGQLPSACCLVVSQVRPWVRRAAGTASGHMLSPSRVKAVASVLLRLPW